jgi:hypothetical protein
LSRQMSTLLTSPSSSDREYDHPFKSLVSHRCSYRNTDRSCYRCSQFKGGAVGASGSNRSGGHSVRRRSCFIQNGCIGRRKTLILSNVSFPTLIPRSHDNDSRTPLSQHGFIPLGACTNYQRHYQGPYVRSALSTKECQERWKVRIIVL